MAHKLGKHAAACDSYVSTSEHVEQKLAWWSKQTANSWQLHHEVNKRTRRDGRLRRSMERERSSALTVLLGARFDALLAGVVARDVGVAVAAA